MRLIDADELLKHIPPEEMCSRFAVENALTVDAVPVIRCSECKFVGTDATCCFVCNRDGMGLRPYHVHRDDYCSYGERKDNG